MPLLITLSRVLPDSTVQTLWTGGFCSSELTHALPERLDTPEPPRPVYVRVPVFNAAGMVVPRTVEYMRRDNCDLCHNCGDDCRNCPFPVW